MWKLQLFSLLFALYLIWRFVLPLQLRPRYKALACLLLALVGARFTLFQLLGGSLLSPDFPHALLLLISYLASTMMLLGALVLARDLLLLLANVLRLPRLPLPWYRTSSLALLLLTLSLSAIGTREAVAPPPVVAHDLTLPRLPKALDGLRIVQLTDLHLGTLNQESWIRDVVERTNALNADLVLLTGDMVDGSPQQLSAMTADLAGLKARYGVYGILGNHEYYSDIDLWLPEFARLGITMLQNEHRMLTINGEPVALIGLTDHAAERFGKPMPNLKQAMTGLPPYHLSLLMAHQPKDARKNSRQGIDLQLSGHTHGGMVRGLDLLVSRVNKGFVSGWYHLGKMAMFVSPGTGLWSGFALRLGVPGEISLIILHSQPDKP